MLLEINGFELVYANLFIDESTVLLYATHGRNSLAKIFKNLDIKLEIILSDCQNNYVGISNMISSAAKSISFKIK